MLERSWLAGPSALVAFDAIGTPVCLVVASFWVSLTPDDWILLIIRVRVWVGVHRGCAVAAYVEELAGPGVVAALWGLGRWAFRHDCCKDLGQWDLYCGQQRFFFDVRGSRGASKIYLFVKVQLEAVE